MNNLSFKGFAIGKDGIASEFTRIERKPVLANNDIEMKTRDIHADVRRKHYAKQMVHIKPVSKHLIHDHSWDDNWND